MQHLSFLKEGLIAREKNHTLRHLEKNDGLIDFASNDYLGLARSNALKEKIAVQIHSEKELNGFGSTGSRLITGQTDLAEKIERQLALSHGFEACLLFSCGYMANIGLLSALKQCAPTFIYDEAIHASMHDGMALSRALAYPFRHNDLQHLNQRLENACQTGNRFVCIESLYSMDGSIAKLSAIYEICKRHAAHLIVDEAHACGALGSKGMGLVANENFSAVFAKVLTFGKAYGIYGAAILCSSQLRNYLVNFSRPFIYTTALPLQNLYAIQAVCDLLPQMDEEREKLRQKVQLFKQHLKTESSTPIQPLYLDEFINPQQVASHLKANGFKIKVIRPPTVPKNLACIRICLHSFNTNAEILALIHELKYLKET